MGAGCLALAPTRSQCVNGEEALGRRPVVPLREFRASNPLALCVPEARQQVEDFTAENAETAEAAKDSTAKP
ncbi:MAG: hypothetical protein Kow00123_08610 [Anaerolineales bacterium]